MSNTLDDRNKHLDAAVEALSALGHKDPSFASVVQNIEGTVLTVFRNNQPSGISEQVYAALVHGPLSLRFAQASLSRQEYLSLMRHIAMNQAWLFEHGIDIQHWGGSGGNPFTLTYTGRGVLNRVVRNRLELYGPGSIQYTRSCSIPLAYSEATDR